MIGPKLLRSTALALCVAFVAGTAALVQEPAPPGLEDIMERLDVTAESVTLVEPVVSESLESHAAIRETAGGEDEARAALDREHRRTHEKLEGVLNEAQFEEWGRIQNELDAYVLSGIAR
jgi:hypothetical protein